MNVPHQNVSHEWTPHSFNALQKRLNLMWWLDHNFISSAQRAYACTCSRGNTPSFSCTLLISEIRCFDQPEKSSHSWLKMVCNCCERTFAFNACNVLSLAQTPTSPQTNSERSGDSLPGWNTASSLFGLLVDGRPGSNNPCMVSHEKIVNDTCPSSTLLKTADVAC